MSTPICNLPIYKQVEFINVELKKDSSISLNKIISTHALKKNKFKAAGYIYAHELRAYVKEDELLQKQNKSTTIKVTPKEVPGCIVEEKKSKSTNEVYSTENSIDMKNIQKTLLEVSELLEMKEAIKELLQKHNRCESIQSNDPKELKLDRTKFDGTTKNRVIKVYENVNTDWIKFCNQNKQYKMQDLYSLALLEFIEKYKK